MRKIMIIGATGQLGAQFAALYENDRDVELFALTHADLEISDRRKVNKCIEDLGPDIIINTAAYRKVDLCEEHPDKAHLVNVVGARNVAQAAAKAGALIVHMSSDYVFGYGDYKRHLGCREYDPPDPVNEYGRTVVFGEEFLKSVTNRYFICRTAWLFGPPPPGRPADNFVAAMAARMRESEEIAVVHDQTGSPSYAPAVARQIVKLIGTDAYGTYHVANRGHVSWYDLALEIRHELQVRTIFRPVTRKEFFTKARRPGFSALDNYNLRLKDMEIMPSWEESLKEYISTL